jgi:hypothetical protein
MAIETTGYFLITGIIAIFAAYYAMKFTAMRREQREEAAKRRAKMKS